MKREVSFGLQKVGDEYPCFITLEAGPTHDGIETAKTLVKHAAEAGANAVKFQIFDPDRLVADKKQLFEYDVLVDKETGARETVFEPLYDILCRRCLSESEWIDLKCYSNSFGLAFFATVGFEEDIKFLEQLGCDSIKIASADVNHFPLIRKAARTGMCLQLDTGNASLGEIEQAIDVITAEGNENIIIHQCPSGYPARVQSINLNLIKTMRQMFSYPVAFSDHTPGWDMDIAAVTMGANLVEKTISLDRATRSVEHIMSIEPHEVKQFVQAIRDVEIAMGSNRRIMHPAEIEKRDRIRRSTFLLEDVKAGQKLSDVKVEFRRPGDGIQPDRYEEIKQSAVFNHDLAIGHKLTSRDLG